MNRDFLTKTFVSVLLLVVALAGLQALWIRYQVDPVTRDGKVTADVVQVAPDVSGWITAVHVQDNEIVTRGQELLTLDQPRYRFALIQAQANLYRQTVALAQAKREDRRNHALSSLVDTQTIEEGHEKVELLRAAVMQATAARDLAQLNLTRTVVRAPVGGMVSNMTLQPGDYLVSGKEALALVYLKSLRIEGYFEETKLPAIHVGDRAQVRLMGIGDVIQGHVESIAGGVQDRERTKSASNLANIQPSFTWVRLAQRIPVRIAIDKLPPGMRLIAGQTASVEILPRVGEVKIHRSWPW